MAYITNRVGLFVFLLGFVIASPASGRPVYVDTKAKSFEELDKIVSELERSGVVVRHIFPPSELIVEVEPAAAEGLGQFANITLVATEAEDFRSDSLSLAKRAFAYVSHADTEQSHIPASAHRSLHGCVPMPELPPAFRPIPTQQGPLVSSAKLFTAEYMVGRVALVLLLMESTGNDENWTTQKENIALGKIVSGAGSLSSQAQALGVKLTWVYEIHTAVPTSYEPIQEKWVPYYSYIYPPLSWEFLWLNDAFSAMDVGSEWDGAYELANTRRQTYRADWAYEVCMVMDDNDSDHSFSNGYSDYAPVYMECCDPNPQFDPPMYKYPSPLVIMTYNGGAPNGWFTIDRDFAHETGHVFGAPDEYSGGYGCAHGDECGATFGYLHASNGNCEVCNSPAAHCLMRDEYVGALCPYTIRHWGWYDSDGDGPVDAIDPNYPWWQSISPVQEGDLVRIFTLDGDVVKTIAVSENNRDPFSLPGYVIWDGLNNWGYQAAPDNTYLVTINNGSPFHTNLRGADPAIHPVFSNISFDGARLHWELDKSFARVRCFLYDEDDQSLVGRPLWDVQRSADPGLQYTTDVDTSALRGPTIAKFYGWRPDGGASAVTSFRMCSCPCSGDPQCDGVIDVLDVVQVIGVAFRGAPAKRDRVCGRDRSDVNCDGFTTVLDVVTMIGVAFRGASQTTFCNPCS